jgi:hypothetical protein
MSHYCRKGWPAASRAVSQHGKGCSVAAAQRERLLHSKIRVDPPSPAEHLYMGREPRMLTDGEDTMQNWLELHLLGREKMAAELRAAEESRRGKAGRKPGTGKRPATIILSRGEVLGLRAGRGNLRVTCRTGRMWVTTDRSREDSVLSTGEWVSYHDGGTVVIEALRTSTLRLEAEQEVRVVIGAPVLRLQFNGAHPFG